MHTKPRTIHGTARQAVWPFFAFVLLALVVVQLSRVLLVTWHLERVSETGGLAYILLQGLRFDLVALGSVLAVPCLVAPWLLAFRPTYQTTGKVLRILFAIVVACFFFLEISTPSFIEEYGTRPNYLFVEYLIYPKEVLATLWGAYPFQLIFSTLVVPVILLGTYRLMNRGPKLDGPLPLSKAAFLSLSLAFVCFAAARSTTDHRAVNPSTVCFSSDPLVNTFPLNSLYSAAYGLYELSTSETDAKPAYGEMPYQEVVSEIRKSMGYPREAFFDPSIPTLHRQESSAPRERPLNFVIMLQESLGAEFVGAMGGLPLTPNLDKLLAEGMTFDNLFATGTRSARGIEAVVSGFLPTPVRSTVKLPRSQSNFFTIAELLQQQGYSTSFLYGGEAQFDNMARFFTGNGFETIVDHHNFENPTFEGSWGASDQDLFHRAHKDFEAMGDKPFFSLVFSSSNHSPWDFPEDVIELYEEPRATRNNAVKYADYALGEFFDLARESSYWNNTVFLVVADHNSRVFGAEHVPVERFHIPATFLGGSVSAEHVPAIASQIDLIPTALSLMGIDTIHPGLGLDLTLEKNAAAAGRAVLQYNSANLYLTANKAVLQRPDYAVETMSWDGENFGPAEPDLELEKRALAYALWPQLSYRNGDYHLPLE